MCTSGRSLDAGPIDIPLLHCMLALVLQELLGEFGGQPVVLEALENRVLFASLHTC